MLFDDIFIEDVWINIALILPVCVCVCVFVCVCVCVCIYVGRNLKKNKASFFTRFIKF